MYQVLRGGRGKHNGYSGGPWPNEDRKQPCKEPEKRRGEAILLATSKGVGLVFYLEMGLLNRFEDTKGGDEAERPETGLRLQSN